MQLIKQEILDKARKLIDEGHTCRQICLFLMKGDICEPTFNKYLGDYYNQKKQIDLIEKYKKAIEAYKKNSFYVKLAAIETGFCDKTIKNALKYFNIEQVNVLKNNQNSRKNKVNEHYFEKIDSSEKAYYLGLMYADGCVYMKDNPVKNMVKLSLTENDAYILEKLNQETNFGREMKKRIYKDGRGKPFITWDVNSKKMCLDLIDKGCVQRKSLILEFPPLEKLNYDFFPDFLRGLFDGDGSACLSRSLAVSLTLSHKFCEQLSVFLKKEIDAETRIINCGNFSMVYMRGVVDAIKFYHYIYKNSNLKIFLRRKRENFELFIDRIKEKRNSKQKIEILKMGKINYV